MLLLKDYRSTVKGVPDLLPYALLADDGIVLTKDGAFIAGWICVGKDTDSATPEDLMQQSNLFNQAAKLLGSGWMLQMNAFRVPHKAYPDENESHFEHPLAKLFDAERRSFFGSGQCYTTATTLTATYKPDIRADKIAGATQSGVSSLPAIEKSLETFKRSLEEFEELLSSVLKMERMREYYSYDETARPFMQSDILSHIQQCLTGDIQPVRLPPVPMYLDALLPGDELIGGIAPKFGEKHISVLSIDGLPSSSQPAMLSILDKLPISYRWNTRAIMLDQFEAVKEVEVYWKTWNQQVFRFIDKLTNNANARANVDAALMRDDASDAKLAIQNGKVAGCYVTSTIILMDEDQEKLDEQTRELRRTIRALGFGCRIETVNAMEAWLGTHPGNGYANLRRPFINTLNLADLLPLHSVWTGAQYCPCPFYPSKSPALSVVLTDGSTPFWLNLHVGDLGHTLILGPTGAGKSTFLCHLAYEFHKYPGYQIFAFDKGMSMYVLNQGLGGVHYDIGNTEGLGFAPLSQIDSPGEMAWAEEWIANLMELQGVRVLPSHRRNIHDAMTRLAGNPSHMRGLTEFSNLVPDMEIKETIAHYTVKGAMGHLLDAKQDSFGFSRFTVFEIEALMNMGDKNMIPVLTYLFHRIEQALTGAPTVLFLDEAWLMLGHSVFREKIREWLKVFRKKNCAVVLASQSLSDAKRSGIMDVLVESCLTKFLLPNYAAKQEDQLELYKDIGCNARVVDVLAGESMPKRDYYLMTPQGKRLIQLGLLPKELAFVAASDPETIEAVKRLQRECGASWQQEWLKLKNAA